ncbi:hypothetical protein OAH36_00240 [Verrucomicrobia bacterium]|jgi:hypothetical protein|nr:hypothetical protein [Verrucomicrobiota bacterium]MDA7680465.1 hypothetical protein [bacterium]MDB4798004.1 hypothetical protein [Verrucomicrobiota bacterium]
MSLANPTPELLSSLGKMLRGLSALFWGLPLVLISSVQSQSLGGARELALIIPCLTNGLLVFGLTQLTHFNPQERIWREAIDRAKVLAIVNVGLSPFLYFWARLPEVPLYAIAVDLLYLSSLLFLYNFNLVIYRLTTMLPDESLRGDAQLFTQLNRSILATIVIMTIGYLLILRIGVAPPFLHRPIEILEARRSWFAIFFLLAPVAMTMTLTWKVKELVIDGVFNSEFWHQFPATKRS